MKLRLEIKSAIRDERDRRSRFRENETAITIAVQHQP
jgi:hypothetical protein